MKTFVLKYIFWLLFLITKKSNYQSLFSVHFHHDIHSAHPPLSSLRCQEKNLTVQKSLLDFLTFRKKIIRKKSWIHNSSTMFFLASRTLSLTLNFSLFLLLLCTSAAGWFHILSTPYFPPNEKIETNRKTWKIWKTFYSISLSLTLLIGPLALFASFIYNCGNLYANTDNLNNITLKQLATKCKTFTTFIETTWTWILN